MKNHRKVLTLIVLVAGAFCGQARADIAFEQTMVKASAREKDKPVGIVYPFRNVGTEPVQIDGVKVSCGCMSAGRDDKTYQPGESGVVRVWFDPSGREGVQKRTVSVFVHEGGRRIKHLLGLEVRVE